MSNFNRVELLDIIEEYASFNNLISSEAELSECFDDMIAECMPAIDTTDNIMICELFNDWSDSLCSDGEIHPEQLNNYNYIGKYSV